MNDQDSLFNYILNEQRHGERRKGDRRKQSAYYVPGNDVIALVIINVILLAVIYWR
jgi:hypothetical protein